MKILKMINLGLRFLLELSMLGIFGYWGYRTGGSTTWLKLLLGIGTPILFAIIWGTFLAPKASIHLREPWPLLLELIIFGLAGWALFSTGKTNLAIVFGIIYVLNKTLILIWRQ